MHSKSPLMYQWHDKQYLGAAHGISGILYVLMQADDTSQDMDSLVKPTLEYLHTLHFPSGNFPSSLGSRGGDMLVHWCHGAPGFLFMFARAYTMLDTSADQRQRKLQVIVFDIEGNQNVERIKGSLF
ncbi:PREDICTED: lanC-like protein 1 [Priapulus caudatus]|uniref:LanC-like protein 1 n=1 Tax=Priapulus caudatus TaxID=37621 RepID=A0ABM1ER49_PRICU|nr:PREDICTED: lanC-like protein 1 [Priapulus caudatus]